MAKKRRTQAGRAQCYARIGMQFVPGDLDNRTDVKFPRRHDYRVPDPFHAWTIVADGVHAKGEALMERS